MPWKENTASTSCCCNFPLLGRRGELLAVSGVAKSVMGSSLAGDTCPPSGQENFPTQSRCVGDYRIQWFIVDGERLWHLSFAYGCGSSIAPALRGYRNGVDKEDERFAVLSIFGDEDILVIWTKVRHRRRYHCSSNGHKDYWDYRGDNAGGARPS